MLKFQTLARNPDYYYNYHILLATQFTGGNLEEGTRTFSSKEHNLIFGGRIPNCCNYSRVERKKKYPSLFLYLQENLGRQ